MYSRADMPANMSQALFTKSPSIHIAMRRNYGASVIAEADERLEQEVAARRTHLKATLAKEEVIKKKQAAKKAQEDYESSHADMKAAIAKSDREIAHYEHQLEAAKVKKQVSVHMMEIETARIKNVTAKKEVKTEKERRREATFKRKEQEKGMRPVGMVKPAAAKPQKFSGFRLAKREDE
jgi:septal ring factor EnvC (AmiA/AmiB activator)